MLAAGYSGRAVTHENPCVGFADKVCVLRLQVGEDLVEGFEPTIEVGSDLGIRGGLIVPV